MDIQSTLDYQIGVFSRLPDQLTNLKSQDGILETSLGIAERQQAKVQLARDFYKTAVDAVYEHSVGEVQKLLNTALEYVFHDKLFSCKIELDEARGAKTMDIYLLDNAYTPPLQMAIEDGVGQGVRTVISFVLHVYYLINKGAAPLLCVDEAYSFISEDYVEKFFDFVKGLAQTKGLCFVMVSHDPRLVPYADKVYRVSNGVVTEGKPEEKKS